VALIGNDDGNNPPPCLVHTRYGTQSDNRILYVVSNGHFSAFFVALVAICLLEYSLSGNRARTLAQIREIAAETAWHDSFAL
jgi:hypothetical protein